MFNPVPELIDLAKNENEAVAKSATKALAYADELKEGNISQDEYEALLGQLATSKEIAEAVDEQKLKGRLGDLLNALIKYGPKIVGL
jgi:hypothetical protein